MGCPTIQNMNQKTMLPTCAPSEDNEEKPDTAMTSPEESGDILTGSDCAPPTLQEGGGIGFLPGEGRILGKDAVQMKRN